MNIRRCPSHIGFSLWEGVSPGNNESAGKRRSDKSTPGNGWLNGTLTEAASRSKETCLNARYHRLAVRRGKKRAYLVIGDTILIIAYHIIKDQCTYKKLGSDYFDRLNELHIVRRLTSRIQALGYHVCVERLSMAA
mgnify:CR=1 FL=1